MTPPIPPAIWVRLMAIGAEIAAGRWNRGGNVVLHFNAEGVVHALSLGVNGPRYELTREELDVEAADALESSAK